MPKNPDPTKKEGVSKVKIALGAASLFLFIVGVKRTFRTEETEERPRPPDRERERDRERDPLGR